MFVIFNIFARQMPDRHFYGIPAAIEILDVNAALSINGKVRALS